mgnify:CR=1 FL=1
MKPSKKAIKQKWWRTGAVGALCLGTGVSGCVECGFLKHGGAPLWQWAGGGTIFLFLVVFGVVFLIKAGLLEKEWKDES